MASSDKFTCIYSSTISLGILSASFCPRICCFDTLNDDAVETSNANIGFTRQVIYDEPLPVYDPLHHVHVRPPPYSEVCLSIESSTDAH